MMANDPERTFRVGLPLARRVRTLIPSIRALAAISFLLIFALALVVLFKWRELALCTLVGDADSEVAHCTRAIESEELGNHVLATTYYFRGLAWMKKRDYDPAITDFDAAIRINPKDADFYFLRGLGWSRKRDNNRAIADFKQAIAKNPKLAAAYNSIAWLLATSTDEPTRDGKRPFAQTACELSSWKEPNYIDTLAAAYAEAGRFADAVRWQEKALESLASDKAERPRVQARLQLYRASTPYRE